MLCATTPPAWPSEDSAGRRQLALLYARFRQPLKAADLLVAGLDHARNDLPYWQLTVELLAETKQDGEILRLARETLPSMPDRAPALPSSDIP